MEEKLNRREKRFETEQLMKEKRSEEYEVLEEVFDRSTLMTIYSLLNRDFIKDISGVIGSGKESRIYYGINSKKEELAIKIYLVISTDYKRGLYLNILEDSRFKNVKHDRRSLIYSWTQKEFKNLQTAYKNKVRVPKPIHAEKNVLIMEFIGKNQSPASLLKEKPPLHPNQMYKTILEYVRILYQKANLIHGDLSEYNIMNYNEEPVLFDFAQAVPREHPKAKELLYRDLNILNFFFRKVGAKIRKVDNLNRWVTSND